MPPSRKIKKEDIIDATLDLLKTESMENINARSIAKKLNCSVQPIFYNFNNMEDVKTIAFERIYNIYKSYMEKGSQEEQGYKGMGLAYIKFARDNPNYFKLLFMQETNFTPEHLIMNDDAGNNVIIEGMKLTGYTYEEQTKFHVKVWIFTHGIAALLATKTVTMTDEEIDGLLKETVHEMIIGRKKENK